MDFSAACGVAETAQRFGDDVLHVRLARVDDVVNRNGGLGKMRSGRIALESGGGPNRFAFGSVWPFAVVEIFAEQAEFPELIGNVFADVGDGAVRADDDFVLSIFFVVDEVND